MRVMPRSIGARITLAYAIGMALALSAGLSVLFVAMDRELRSAVDQGLGSRGAHLVTALGQGDLQAVANDQLAQLYSDRGAVLAESPALHGQRLASVRAVSGLSTSTFTKATPTSPIAGATTDLRVLSLPLADGRVVSVAVSNQDLRDARRRLTQVLLYVAPLLIGVLALAGWLLVRGALRPVGLLTREAAAISSLESDRRLPRVDGDDEIARLSQTLDSMLARLRIAFERERAFVDDASHELRSPIAVLRGELELALSAADDPVEVERSLRVAIEEADRLQGLAEDLLLLARERAGAMVLRHEPIDLHDVISAEARRLEPVLGIRIAVSGDPVVLTGDADRLRQVITNLVHNSAAAGSANVGIDLAAQDGVAQVHVADDGPGFPATVLDRAFERFSRGDAARTSGSSGAGLGLSIARAVVTGHGGSIDAHNGGPLGGAVLTVELPLH
jgi:signal transduction histidine kinase